MKRPMLRRFSIPVGVFLFLTFTVSGLEAAENYLYHSIQASVLVTDPARASEELASWSENIGGYYVLKSTDRVIIRIPYGAVLDLKEYLEENTDELYSYIPAAQDVRSDILYIRSSIESREEILERNLGYLDRADVSGTLAVETEVMEILKELEDLKGELRVLNQNRTYAYAEISLQFHAETLPEKIPTSFPWLNSLDMYSFIRRGVE